MTAAVAAAGGPRFFVEVANSALAPGLTLELPADVVRHVQVLRLAADDVLVLFNGEGGEFTARLLEISKRSALAQIETHVAREVEAPYRITLAQGIAGGDKMDWLIEKAVELGVARIVPLGTARSVVRLSGERAEKRVAHWQGIVRAACEQCGRNRVPAVAPVRELRQWLAALPEKPVDGELRLLLSPRASIPFAELPANAPIGEVTLLIGPEGGLSQEEEDMARAQGFTALQLGARILRTETAGIAVLAALAARWGGWV